MKGYIYILIVLLSVFFIFRNELYSQACCTAGAPLLGSLEMTSAPKGVLQLGLTAEHNSLKHVLNGTQKLRNPERERVSQSILLELNYGLTNNLSITGLFSYIRQERTITNLINFQDQLSASGIGDVALLAKYSIIPFDIIEQQELSFGAGLKVPTGNSSLKSNGILLPADMQSGSGSWDGIFWGYYMIGGLLHPDLTFLSNLSFRMNGTNARFKNSSIGYKFGNEFIGSIGLNYLIASFIDVTLLAKFRNTQSDYFGENSIPNTGGEWLYFVPGISFYLNDKFSTRVDGELPIYRNVEGTQLTTTFTASISLFYSLNLIEGSL